MDCLNKTFNRFKTISWNLRTVLLVLSGAEVIALIILTGSYIGTATETLELYPDHWEYVVYNFLMKAATLIIYSTIYWFTWKEDKLMLLLMAFIDSICIAIRFYRLVVDLYKKNPVAAITTGQLLSEVVLLVILVVYSHTAWRDIYERICSCWRPVTKNPAPQETQETDETLIELI